MDDKELKFGSRAIHAGYSPESEFGAIMPPIYQTSTYVQKSPGEYRENYDYSRSNNPTRAALERNLAALEGAEHGLCFSSGLASISAVLHLLSAGDHVVLSDDVYGGTFRLFDKIFSQLGIEFTQVDMSDLNQTADACNSNTRMVMIETPTNPLLKIVDIEALSKLAHDKGALAVVDNTFASPYLQQPFKLGADIVLHSTTKYLGGHSDLIGGAVLVNDPEILEKLRLVQLAVGAVPGIWECFLTLRSTKTLHLRMDRHCQNAKQIAAFLDQHPKIEKVIYPGLESHPQHELAKKQMKDFGGMITAVLSGGLAASKKFLENTVLFSLAESLGGVESLIEHPAIMTHASLPAEMRKELGISDGLVRLSVGVEDVDDLLADLEKALATV